MNLTALHNDFYQKSGEQENNTNELVAAGLLYIMGHYITQWCNNFVLTLTCNREQACIFYDDLVGKMFAGWHEWPLQIVNVQKSQNARIEGIRYNNMIFTDSYASFLEADLSSYTSQNNYNEYYYIMLQHYDAYIPEEMQQIFEYCWQNNLINCIVQIHNAKGEVLIYTYFPFSEEHCGSVKAVLINQFSGASMVHPVLFPRKLRNFYGCPLKVATWHVPPFLTLSNNSEGTMEVNGGFEGYLLKELSSRLNFTIDIRVPENNAQRGFAFENGTLTGALKMLYERNVDLSIGAFRLSGERSAVATSTINYYQSPISVVAVEDIYLLTSMETLLFPFSRDTWFLSLLVLILIAATVAVLKQIYRAQLPKDIGKGSMDIILMLMGMPAIYRPMSAAIRIFNVSWMSYALLIRTTYQALLFLMIRTHFTIDAPQHLEELAPRGYSMVMNDIAAKLASQIPALKTTKIITLSSPSDTSSMEFLDSLPVEEAERYVAALPLDLVTYYVQHKRKEGYFRVLPFDVMFFKICIYLSKHSFLVEQLDESLIWFQGSGLVESWARFVQDRRFHIRQRNREDRLFDFDQLQMLFVFLLCGYLLGMLTLAMELLYERLGRDKRFSKT